MDSLRDIQGLTEINIFPLAFSVKVVLSVVGIGIVLLCILSYQKLKFYFSWRYALQKILVNLEKNIDNYTNKEIADNIVYCLKLILIQEYGSKAAASKAGTAMLLLLQDRDPNNFNWMLNGRVLLELPYAPPGSIASADLNSLINATKSWLKNVKTNVKTNAKTNVKTNVKSRS